MLDEDVIVAVRERVELKLVDTLAVADRVAVPLLEGVFDGVAVDVGVCEGSGGSWKQNDALMGSPFGKL